MTYDEMKALIEGMKPEEYDDSKILEKLNAGNTPADPVQTPPSDPTPNPITNDTKADTPITMTVAELLKFATEIAAKQNPKKVEETEDDDAEIYL